MRPALLFPLLALPMVASAFDQVDLSRPAALQGVQEVHVAETTATLAEPSRRFDPRGREPRPVRPADASSKAAELTEALRRGFARDFRIVDAAGPGVLVVKPTLTRLSASRPTLADYERQPGLSFDSVYAGGASVSIVFERDGQPVATVQDSYNGSFSDGTPRIGIWQDTDRAFDRWARQLPDFVAVPHGNPQ